MTSEPEIETPYPRPKSRVVALLLWIAVLPGATASALLSIIAARWMLTLLIGSFLGPAGGITVQETGHTVPYWGLPMSGLESIVTALLAPYFFITVGSSIAPACKWVTEVALAILYVIALVILLTAAVGSGQIDIEFQWTSVLSIVAVPSGIAWALLSSDSRPRTKKSERH